MLDWCGSKRNVLWDMGLTISDNGIIHSGGRAKDLKWQSRRKQADSDIKQVTQQVSIRLKKAYALSVILRSRNPMIFQQMKLKSLRTLRIFQSTETEIWWQWNKWPSLCEREGIITPYATIQHNWLKLLKSSMC